MSGKLREGTKRASYIEEAKIDRALTLLAVIKKTNRSAIIRKATATLVAKEDGDGQLRAITQ
jgi:hypothetical protein